MKKKILFSITVVLTSIFFIWGVITVNLIVTDAFNSIENKRYTVDYEDIKEKVGVDLEDFSHDNAYIKFYDLKGSLILVLGDKFIDFNNNILTNQIARGFYFITNGVNNINNYLYDIFY